MGLLLESPLGSLLELPLELLFESMLRSLYTTWRSFGSHLEIITVKITSLEVKPLS